MNKMFNFNGMPRKRSGHAGGKGVSTIGMLVLLMAALLVLPSCFDDDDDETVTENVYVCPDGTTADSKDDCPAVEPPPRMTQCLDGTTVTAPAECPDPPQYDHVIMEDDDKDFTGGDAPDSIAGDMRNNEIRGMGGNDEISGMGGNDTLIGGDGEDTLRGGEGDDMLTGGAGNDMLDGGEGGEEKGDTADYSDDAMRVRVNLEMSKANVIRQASTDPFAGAAEEDTLTNIENVTGSPGADEITGDSEDNTLNGGGGNDMIMGGGGDDTLVDEDYTAEPENSATSIDTHDGGAGNDTLVIKDTRGLTIDLTGMVNGTKGADGNLVILSGGVASGHIKTAMMGDDSVSTIENIDCDAGAASVCTITGDDRPNMLNGGGGNDTLNGGGGNDTLNGGGGNDTYDGGEGSDMIYADTADQSIDGGIGPMSEADSPMDLGVDTLSYAKVTEDMDENTLGDQGVASLPTLTSIEVLVLSPLNDNVRIGAVHRSVDGGGGNDTIEGHSGRDMIIGGEGDDTLSSGGGACTDADDCKTDDEFDKAQADVLAGGPGNDTLTGAVSSTDVFAVHAGMGNDKIDTFTLKEDHLHFLDLAGGDGSYNCHEAAGENTVICTLPGEQTITIEHTGTPSLTKPLDFKGDLNIVVVPPEGS